MVHCYIIMSNSNQFNIQNTYSGDYLDYFNIEFDKGYLKSQFNNEKAVYEVLDYLIWPNYRRKGFGKELLSFGVSHARTLGAKAITGTMITSRESLDVVRSIAGDVNVDLDVRNEGDYSPAGSDDSPGNRTDASVYWRIEG